MLPPNRPITGDTAAAAALGTYIDGCGTRPVAAKNQMSKRKLPIDRVPVNGRRGAAAKTKDPVKR